MTAISAARAAQASGAAVTRTAPGSGIAVLDGARRLGAKILVAGGGRCNVTHEHVAPDDFYRGNRNILRRVLAALPVPQTIAFFSELGVALHVEEYGKLFPDSNSARTVLDALLNECRRLGVALLTDHRVTAVEPSAGGFTLGTSAGPLVAGRVVLATGGMSLPKSGSDGGGYELARRLGHTIAPCTPALAPLVLDGDFHAPLSGVSHDVELTLRVEGERPLRIRGPLLWTHFGVSGPAPLNISGAWHRTRLEGRPAVLGASLLPGEDFARAEARLIGLAARQPRTALHNALAALLPARVADALLARLEIAPQTSLAQLARDARRRLVHALIDFPLPVRDSRGFTYAEVTSGGVPLEEIDAVTMESRRCPGLHLVGEILDVDGRIGGFNFQWAWASGHVAGTAVGKIVQ